MGTPSSCLRCDGGWWTPPWMWTGQRAGLGPASGLEEASAHAQEDKINDGMLQQLSYVLFFFFFAINHTVQVLVPYLQGRCRCSSRLQLSWDTQQTHRLVPDGRDPPPPGASGTQMVGTLQETKSVSLLKMMMSPKWSRWAAWPCWEKPYLLQVETDAWDTLTVETLQETKSVSPLKSNLWSLKRSSWEKPYLLQA